MLRTRPRIQPQKKPKQAAPPLSPLLAQIDAALPIFRELNPPDVPVFHDVRDERPTKAVAMQVALDALKPKDGARVGVGDLERLHAAIEATEPDERHFIGRFLAETMRRLRILRPEHGACTWPPRDNLQSLLAVDGGSVAAADWAELRAEARDFGADPRTLVALAVLLTPEESFGVLAHLPAARARLEEEYEVTCAPIATLWTRSDVTWVLTDEALGLGRMVFAKWPEVSVYPLHDTGKRLVAWIASHKRRR